MTGPLPLSNDEVQLVLRIMDQDLTCRANCGCHFRRDLGLESHALQRKLYEKLLRHYGRYSVKWNMIWFDENQQFIEDRGESE